MYILNNICNIEKMMLKTTLWPVGKQRLFISWSRQPNFF
jgi:hypothetical protein